VTAPPTQQSSSRSSESRELPAPQDYGSPDARKTRPDAARGLEDGEAFEPEDAYLLLPRALLFAPKFVLSVAYLPIRGALTLVDRYHLVEHTEDLLYNDERTAAIYPTASYQTGYGLSYGVAAFHEDVFGHAEEISGEARYGGLYQQAYKASFEAERTGGSLLWLELDARWEAKPALLFFGIGNRSLSSTATNADPRDVAVATRHRERRFMANATLGSVYGKIGSRSHFGVNALFNVRDYGSEERSFSEPSIEEVYDTALIPGFDDGATVLEITPLFSYDTRDTEGFTSSGNYFEIFGGHTLPVTDDADFWHYGATFATFFDLYKGSRVLSLRAVVEAVHGHDVPFSDLIKLGGPERLRGFELDRFRDKHAVVATAEYRYPIHELIAGELFFDAGTVGSHYADMFDADGLDLIRYGGGMGFVFHNEEKTYFKIEGAYGEDFVFFFATDPLQAFARRHKRL
jgi:outer membrane protein assembly factor BamA